MSWPELESEPFERLTTSLGITGEGLAQIVSADSWDGARWNPNEVIRDSHNRSRLESLEALVARLEESFKTPEGADCWLSTESGYLGGVRPIDILLQGHIDAVNAALEALDSGVFV